MKSNDTIHYDYAYDDTKFKWVVDRYCVDNDSNNNEVLIRELGNVVCHNDDEYDNTNDNTKLEWMLKKYQANNNDDSFRMTIHTSGGLEA